MPNRNKFPASAAQRPAAQEFIAGIAGLPPGVMHKPGSAEMRLNAPIGQCEMYVQELREQPSSIDDSRQAYHLGRALRIAGFYLDQKKFPVPVIIEICTAVLARGSSDPLLNAPTVIAFLGDWLARAGHTLKATDSDRLLAYAMSAPKVEHR